jgi:hypothetical protein
MIRDAKHGAALRHLPSGYPQVNKAWMWGALIATSIAGWLHQLTAIPDPHGPGLLGWGVREDKAMIATLQHRLINVPARLILHAGTLILRLPPDHQLLTEVLTEVLTRLRPASHVLTRPPPPAHVGPDQGQVRPARFADEYTDHRRRSRRLVHCARDTKHHAQIVPVTRFTLERALPPATDSGPDLGHLPPLRVRHLSQDSPPHRALKVTGWRQLR